MYKYTFRIPITSAIVEGYFQHREDIKVYQDPGELLTSIVVELNTPSEDDARENLLGSMQWGYYADILLVAIEQATIERAPVYNKPKLPIQNPDVELIKLSELRAEHLEELETWADRKTMPFPSCTDELVYRAPDGRGYILDLQKEYLVKINEEIYRLSRLP